MVTSAFATLVLISLMFWLCYGQIAPLRWLMGMLLLTFVLSLATAGLFFNQITVIGAGFASVMIGLSVDYGYLIYQQSLRSSGTVGQVPSEYRLDSQHDRGGIFFPQPEQPARTLPAWKHGGDRGLHRRAGHGRGLRSDFDAASP